MTTINGPTTDSLIKSDALAANLAETAGVVVIDPKYDVLREIVSRFKGIAANLEHLLREVAHPYRNWQLLIPELRAFVLKNLHHFKDHARGPEAFELFSQIFFEALADSRKNLKLAAGIIEAMLAHVEKLLGGFDADDLLRYQRVLNDFFEHVAAVDALDDGVMMLVVQGHHPMKKIAGRIAGFDLGQRRREFDFRPLARLMKRILTANYNYWLSEEDPLAWFLEQCGADPGDESPVARYFDAVSHRTLKGHLRHLEGIEIEADPLGGLRQLLKLPAHVDIIRLYRRIPDELSKINREVGGGEAGLESVLSTETQKLLFLFRIMDTRGLYLIHEETLRQVNRSLVQLIRKQSYDRIESFFITTFSLLKANVRRYPHTSLQCIQVIGGEVFKRGSSRLVETFLWETVRFGFQYANVTGVDEDWQPITNPAHLANIRVWLNLIMQEPKWCSTLFSALIINLKLSGTCVKDTDLFQRDITELLNNPIEPIYNLAKQFAKLMPVFFNEIGAEGELRDVSTELDELHKRRDILIHFLRKQSHVESSNLIVGFIKAIFRFWLTLDKSLLAPYLPEEVHAQVATSGPFVDEQHRLANRIRRRLGFDKVQDLLTWDEQERSAFLEAQGDIDAVERRRFVLLIKMYTLLHQKYNLSMQELRGHLEQAVGAGFPEMEGLIARLEINDTFRTLDALLEHLEKLKAVILSDRKFQPREDIYYKRHIAVDIPSVYGRYSERKFDALGLSFRLEKLANIYLEKLGESVNLNFITQATFIRIVKCVKLFMRALRIDGISSRRLHAYVSMLASSIGMKRFSYTQYLDIFRGLSEGVKDVIYAYYTNIHQNNLSIIIPQIGKENLLTKYRAYWRDGDQATTVHQLSEVFFRDLIAATFGLQHFDNFITRIIQTLESQKDLLDEETLDLLMTYNPDKAISQLYNENRRVHNLIHLGNKGFNLMVMAGDGKPVPPAFIITTEIFRCWSAVQSFDRARGDFMQRIRRAITEMEERTGRVFGDPKNPLLLSVRSGSAVSMPGMMTTIHNVGLNEELVEEYIRTNGREYFIWDNYRRFVQSWGMAQDMKREDFQELMNEHKACHNVQLKMEFSPSQMRELALMYHRNVDGRGLTVPDDPWVQLIRAVEMVIASWNTRKAKNYRELMTMSSAWGTAVIVQAMVYGNLSRQAGSGVLFTAHPYRKVRRVALWGDYAPGDQGEDIVSGLVSSYPISVEQAELDGRAVENSLESRFPEIYSRLLDISRDLVYTKGWNPQEIEFTFEGPAADDLYLLQTRDMITIKKQERLNVFSDGETVQAHILGRGIGVSGSALSGRAVFTEAGIRRLREKDPNTPLILIRQDTVPEDIREIFLADGLLTSRGGQTSHASVVATRLEKTCVVGCRDMQVYETSGYCKINGHRIDFGDPVSIDGRKGLFIKGMHPIHEEVHILPI